MVRETLRLLWAEPRPSQVPGRVWRDWGLVGVLVPWSIAEGFLREDLAWRGVAVTVGVVVALTLLWRRTHPLVAVAIAFGSLTAIDGATILASGEPATPWSIVCVLVLPYALFRWGAGREASIGLVIILVWLPVTFTADPLNGGAEWAAGYGFFLFSAALGASIRYHANTRIRDIDQAKLREREQLARELHDTVAHHVSAIAVQAQAGRALAATHPERALATLDVIEEEASRILEEMRTIVGVLRAGEKADLSPQPGVSDIALLARGTGDLPHVAVEISDELVDLSPLVETVVYRIAQESITNAMRHAHHATRIEVRVAGDEDCVRLTVHDDGDSRSPGQIPSGFGLLGMTERATLLGGTLDAGPSPHSGWTVNAVLPRTRAAT